VRAERDTRREMRREKKPRGGPGSRASDLFDWRTSAFSSLDTAHFPALFLLWYTAR